MFFFSLFAVEPGFYPTNWLFIGKCHLQLGKVEEGSKWLIKIATYQSSVSDDIEVRRWETQEGGGGERDFFLGGGGKRRLTNFQTTLVLTLVVVHV